MAYSGDEIRKARQHKRLKQADLAKAVGASPRAANRWESEGVPDNSHYLAEIERVLSLGPYADGAAPNGLDEATEDRVLRGVSHGKFWAEATRRFFQSTSATGVPSIDTQSHGDGPGRGEWGTIPPDLLAQADDRAENDS